MSCNAETHGYSRVNVLLTVLHLVTGCALHDKNKHRQLFYLAHMIEFKDSPASGQVEATCGRSHWRSIPSYCWRTKSNISFKIKTSYNFFFILFFAFVHFNIRALFGGSTAAIIRFNAVSMFKLSCYYLHSFYHFYLFLLVPHHKQTVKYFLWSCESREFQKILVFHCLSWIFTYRPELWSVFLVEPVENHQ